MSFSFGFLVNFRTRPTGQRETMKTGDEEEARPDSRRRRRQPYAEISVFSQECMKNGGKLEKRRRASKLNSAAANEVVSRRVPFSPLLGRRPADRRREGKKSSSSEIHFDFHQPLERENSTVSRLQALDHSRSLCSSPSDDFFSRMQRARGTASRRDRAIDLFRKRR
ncbi:hypothetical protein TGRUB_220580 [Toxoplasma gondii RUB]|uniref:Uncharacterized protein n=11 Tax=Toxoplasma gondii TaxID=5811 RepID=B9Q2E7_TOXGV|nr:hypothetical protein TGGT1_220580 [Toxoplasma gondii GT1]ESS28483.1 hypothetical protein TGVEG_220580 [Toxoplasma gondii VEG]KAF4643635.1 hypothetical protein TGRH88_023890 [Toxoplasma gondii]KFG28339.1 hypothetical protein TGP89_220580 [Toxoplasma gondii p89]KFG30455.1 hypothetical protein TGDOM2_220580 [Toxoplasma gondii GAB2-2007-GAL-DOM2]KFG35344.1 hypothetical protein TGFOU_220580 [Toxoplasma gondii FOU]KFG63031.1 hypothetical protein TGRUB_220580 [Toxoplasma gondii RUB]KFH05392.1 hy